MVRQIPLLPVVIACRVDIPSLKQMQMRFVIERVWFRVCNSIQVVQSDPQLTLHQNNTCPYSLRDERRLRVLVAAAGRGCRDPPESRAGSPGNERQHHSSLVQLRLAFLKDADKKRNAGLPIRTLAGHCGSLPKVNFRSTHAETHFVYASFDATSYNHNTGVDLTPQSHGATTSCPSDQIRLVASWPNVFVFSPTLRCPCRIARRSQVFLGAHRKHSTIKFTSISNTHSATYTQGKFNRYCDTNELEHHHYQTAR